MAHNVKDLVRSHTVMTSTTGRVISEHHLVTNDAAADVEGADYLNASAKQLAKGDSIVAHLVMGGNNLLKHYTVRSISAAGVVVLVAAS